MILTTTKIIWLNATHVIFGMVKSESELTKKIRAFRNECGDCNKLVIISDYAVINTKKVLIYIGVSKVASCS